MIDQSVMQLTQVTYKPTLLIPAVDPAAVPGLKNVSITAAELAGAAGGAEIIELTTDTALTRTAHNGAWLVCLAALTLTAEFDTAGLGFECDVINLSGGSVTIGAGITVGNSATVLAAGGVARLRGLPGLSLSLIHI